MRAGPTPLLVLAVGTAGVVGPGGGVPAAAAQEPSVPSVVARFDLRHEVARFDLPHRLDEISGLAFTADGRLFGHQDETGILYAIDPESGDVGRGFALGSAERPLRDDFEGLAIAGERWFLVSSRGLLYEFREAHEGEAAPVRVTDTRLGGACEVEGLTYDRDTSALLLACKTVAAPHPDEIRIHSLPLDPAAPIPPIVRVPFRALAPYGLEGLHPSGIDVDPVSGAFLLVAAREEALLEISRGGRVVAVYGLRRGRHPQAEGLAFGPDGRLYVADERTGGRARLTVYGPRGGGPSDAGASDTGGKGGAWDGG